MNSGSDHHPRRRRTPLQPIEWLTVVHLSLYVVAATWGFGGQAEWVRHPLTAWGGAGAFITLAALLKPRDSSLGLRKAIIWASPIVAFNLLVLIAAMNPSLRELNFAGEKLFAVSGARSLWPSSALPGTARAALIEFDVVWFSAFNVALVLHRRRAIRALLLVVVANAVLLAVFGTVQKLSGATGLFFGAVPSPQKYFFASFVYHNHWGAFALLALSAAIGLGWHYVRRSEGRDILHSPALMVGVIALILAATVPLSASRSSTLLMIALLVAALLRWLASSVQRRRHYNESIAPPLAIAAGIVVVASAAIWYVAKDTIRARATLTVQQVVQARASPAPDARRLLYRDTWRMAHDKLWFGWGMSSYPHVFTLYNTRASPDRLPVFYHDAHSDWLQAVAEHGMVGTFVLAAAALVPLVMTGRRRLMSAITGWPLGGCALVVLYATLEFPFGNYAVVLCWWVVFFAAIQYARLGRESVVEPRTVREAASM